MSRCLFLTPQGRALGHWLQAFPQAHCSGARGLQSQWFEPGSVVWACGIRLSLLRELVRKYPQMHLVYLSMKPQAQEGLDAVEIGAKGYCHALAAAPMLREVHLVVTHGGLWLGPDLMQRAVQAVAQLPAVQASPGQQRAWDKLTERESAVARCISRGAANKEIASELGITQRTVKAHLAAMFEKLAVRDRLQLAVALGEPPANSQSSSHAA